MLFSGFEPGDCCFQVIVKNRKMKRIGKESARALSFFRILTFSFSDLYVLVFSVFFQIFPECINDHLMILYMRISMEHLLS